jgi:uncharacterized CHY-type Zn-finger protein
MVTGSSPDVRGIGLDAQTRCTHYHADHDVVAIRMFCCGVYYACHQCHAELADHPIRPWPRHQRDARAVRCGVCGSEHTIADYLASGSACPACGAAFNPRCRNHYPLYFVMTETPPFPPESRESP